MNRSVDVLYQYDLIFKKIRLNMSVGDFHEGSSSKCLSTSAKIPVWLLT